MGCALTNWRTWNVDSQIRSMQPLIGLARRDSAKNPPNRLYSRHCHPRSTAVPVLTLTLTLTHLRSPAVPVQELTSSLAMPARIVQVRTCLAGPFPVSWPKLTPPSCWRQWPGPWWRQPRSACRTPPCPDPPRLWQPPCIAREGGVGSAGFRIRKSQPQKTAWGGVGPTEYLCVGTRPMMKNESRGRCRECSRPQGAAHYCDRP
jgi:hypothetical protein